MGDFSTLTSIYHQVVFCPCCYYRCQEGKVRDYARTVEKIITVMFPVQSLSSAGFIAVFTINTLVGVELSDQPAQEECPKP